MPKIIIPRDDLPSLSEEQTNRFRFRIINKNRNLASEWSVIGEVKRQIDDIDYELPDTFSTEAIRAAIIVSWEKSNDISQVYDIYMKQYQFLFIEMSGIASYTARDMILSDSTTNNSTTIHGIYSDRIGFNISSPMGAQIMIQNFSYPRVERLPKLVSGCERVGGVLKIYIDGQPTDFDESNNTNGSVYVDMTIAAESGTTFTTKEDMEVFNRITNITNVDKTNPNYIVLEKTSLGSDIPYFKPLYGTVTRITKDPLFVSDYVNYA